jgi:outer membrane protein
MSSMKSKYPRAVRIAGAACALAGLTAVSIAQTAVPVAQTLEQALVSAYFANPTINAQRAAVRVVDEQVPQALAGYRPQVFGNAQVDADRTRTQTQGATINSKNYPRGYGVTAQQNIFNGFQTGNLVRSAESQVLAARETLRNTEQNVLLDAVVAYMNVIRDAGIVQLQQQNVQALNEQLRATNDRFQVGELTRTDVAQAQARLKAAESALSAAQANLNASRAVYRRDIGSDPGQLRPARPYEKIQLATLDAAVAEAFGKHPAIQATRHGVDTAQLQVKVAEGSLLPTLNLEASVQRFSDPSTTVQNSFDMTAGLRLTVPIYQGGAEYARIRQAKELTGQRQLESDVVRDQVRAAVIQSWGLVAASRFQVEAALAQVAAAEIALNGVREEYRVGQRTTLDVLNAQAELVNARAALITAQRDRVVASYSLLSSLGKLSIVELGLAKVSQTYQPEVHYEQVRDSWFGLRTPDGR